MAKFTMRQVVPAHRKIMAAMEAGRIGPASAAQWARRAARGENLGLLDVLAPVESMRASGPILAHSHQQVMDILTRALTGDSTDDGGDDAPSGPLDSTGNLSASGAITDDEASILFPPKNYVERDRQQAIRRSLGKLRAAGVSPWDDEELHDRLFGTTTGKDAG